MAALTENDFQNVVKFINFQLELPEEEREIPANALNLLVLLVNEVSTQRDLVKGMKADIEELKNTVLNAEGHLGYLSKEYKLLDAKVRSRPYV